MESSTVGTVSNVPKLNFAPLVVEEKNVVLFYSSFFLLRGRERECILLKIKKKEVHWC